ncbi:MAG: hypothetical protein Q7O66_15545, partial [Dehalococcoidia bacterium]|nr:hypothetical protein [Dehalococcoidia bacterium]
MTNDRATWGQGRGEGPDMALMEQVVVGGDLEKMSPAQRVAYYMQVCSSLGLNALTKPFDYIRLNGQLTLYATKTATDQLAKAGGLSLRMVKTERV